MDELKPCPFCGSKSVRLAENTLEGHFIGYSAHCNGCGVENRYTKDKEEAVNAWNTRYLIEYTVKLESDEPKTNGDIIRKMFDDDLGFWKACPVCESCAWFENRECDEDCTKYNCFNGVIAWLKKEANNG